MKPQSSIERQIVERAARSGITVSTATLLETGHVALAAEVIPPSPEAIQARMSASGISAYAAEMLLRHADRV